MSRRILITRPLAEAEETAGLLRARGHNPLTCPLTEIIFAPVALPQGPYAGYVTTSHQAIGWLARQQAERDIPLFVVGEASAARARDAGFAHVLAGSGDARGIAGAIRKKVAPPVSAPLLYLRAEHVSFDLAGVLKEQGYAMDEQVVYSTRALHVLPEELADTLRTGTVDTALFYSRRSLEICEELVEKAGLSGSLRHIEAIAMSERIARAAAAPWKAIRISPTPDQAGIFSSL